MCVRLAISSGLVGEGIVVDIDFRECGESGFRQRQGRNSSTTRVNLAGAGEEIRVSGAQIPRTKRVLAADHLKKHPLKMMSTLTIALNHSKEEEEE